jgi:hypothetical protein
MHRPHITSRSFLPTPEENTLPWMRNTLSLYSYCVFTNARRRHVYKPELWLYHMQRHAKSVQTKQYDRWQKDALGKPPHPPTNIHKTTAEGWPSAPSETEATPITATLNSLVQASSGTPARVAIGRPIKNGICLRRFSSSVLLTTAGRSLTTAGRSRHGRCNRNKGNLNSSWP